jgi:pimeloyl-ACP methyl ester carboxylesterase
VIEPFQRGSGPVPLTVARHVADLRDVLAERFPGERPALVGASWGAMLALAFAAEHVEAVAGVAMVGSGTFDLASRARFQATLAERTTPDLRARFEAIDARPVPPDERLALRAAALDALYQVDPLPDDRPGEDVDERANRETWDDMLRLQADGPYPASLARVRCPVLLVHGDFDPHPGPAIRDGLAPRVRDLTYVEIPRCGHEPWRERHARGPFFDVLRPWLRRVLARA